MVERVLIALVGLNVAILIFEIFFNALSALLPLF